MNQNDYFNLNSNLFECDLSNSAFENINESFEENCFDEIYEGDISSGVPIDMGASLAQERNLLTVDPNSGSIGTTAAEAAEAAETASKPSILGRLKNFATNNAVVNAIRHNPKTAAALGLAGLAGTGGAAYALSDDNSSESIVPQQIQQKIQPESNNTALYTALGLGGLGALGTALYLRNKKNNNNIDLC